MFPTSKNMLLVPLALALAVPAWGEQTRQSQEQDPTRQRDQQRQADARQRQRDQAQQQRQHRRHRSSTSERQQARTHYRAGLAAGYMLGYADGLDDYVLIIGTSADRSDRFSADQSRDELRQQLRERARGEMTGRARGPGSRRPMMARTSPQQRVAGEILATKRVRLQNDQQRHLLALIRTDQGRRRIVDLGPIQQLLNLNLQVGDRITVEGRFLRTRQGTPVLNARRVQSQGNSVAIRGESQQGRQRMQR